MGPASVTITFDPPTLAASDGAAVDVLAAALGAGFMDAFPGRPIVYIANKVDMLEEGRSLDLPAAMAGDGIPVVSTSAKTGQHVREAFSDIAVVIARRW